MASNSRNVTPLGVAVPPVIGSDTVVQGNGSDIHTTIHLNFSSAVFADRSVITGYQMTTLDTDQPVRTGSFPNPTAWAVITMTTVGTVNTTVFDAGNCADDYTFTIQAVNAHHDVLVSNNYTVNVGNRC